MTSFLPNREGADNVPRFFIARRDIEVNGRPHAETHSYEAGGKDSKCPAKRRCGCHDEVWFAEEAL